MNHQQNVANMVIAALTAPTGPLTALNNQLNGLQTTVNNVQTTVNTLQTTVNNIQTTVNNHTIQLSRLEIEMARTSNATKGVGIPDQFTSVPNTLGQQPPIQLATLHDLTNLTGPQATALCNFYGITPIPALIVDQQAAIAQHCGIRRR